LAWIDVPDGIVDGNKDDENKSTHVFAKPFISSSIRLIPISWNKEPCIRWDAFY